MPEKEKAVILFSGGLDSSVLLYQLNQKYKCYPLTIAYGQSHSREIMSARNICEALGKDILNDWKLVRLESLSILLPSALTGEGEIPNGRYDEPSMEQTVVPGRNLIFLAVAAGYAQGLEAGVVAYAAHAGDHFIYPDCRPEFIKAASEAMWLGYGVNLITPFSRVDKGEIVRIGSKLGVPFHMSWTCYKGGERHCGVCGSCSERKEAFKKACVSDPTEYEK